MFILTSSQIREVDRLTIEKKGIQSIDLMERAAGQCFEWFLKEIPKETFIHLFCGQGNNGGDGLALARMLYGAGFQVKATLLKFDAALSHDCQINLERLQKIDAGLVEVVINNYELPPFKASDVIVDSLFGTGLSRPITGKTAKVIHAINASNQRVISIDIPSGLYSNDCSLMADNTIIKASDTLTFQFLKLGLIVGDNAPFFGNVEVLDIGLLEEAIPEKEVKTFWVEPTLIKQIFKPKWEFSHKGNFGHALLITGEKGKMGAAILSAGGFLRSGGGLLTLLVPKDEIGIVQVAVPEAMVATGIKDEDAGGIPSLEPYNVVGVGPGIGTGNSAVQRLTKLLDGFTKPMVLDADAINILSLKRELLSHLPPDSILTPHPGEFKRLAGSWSNDFEKLNKQIELAVKYKVYVILKGRNTSIASPDGTLYFNSTGNAGMAKGGSGDVLTGILTGIKASGYSSLETCLLGVYLHGLAGDEAAEKLSQEGMKAGDLIDFIPAAWKKVAG